jgi:hypothetical protein
MLLFCQYHRNITGVHNYLHRQESHPLDAIACAKDKVQQLFQKLFVIKHKLLQWCMW